LSWRLTFSRLTRGALAAHIHLGRPGVARPGAVPLCGPCVSGGHGREKGAAEVRPGLPPGGADVKRPTPKKPARAVPGARRRGQVTGGHPAATSTTESEPTTTGGGGYGGYGG